MKLTSRRKSLLQSGPAQTASDRETLLVSQAAVFVSALTFLYFLKRGDVLLYGDAVAHINIARRVLDSITPGPLQLGTVWLPLPHILIIPFVAFDFLWRSGIGGSIPSLFAYVLLVSGFFRLADLMPHEAASDRRSAARFRWLATAMLAANPNLIYLQSTALTETVYLAFFIWSVVFIAQSACDGLAFPPLLRAAFCVLGASLTRYDGWFLAVLFAAVLGVLALRRRLVWRKAIALILVAASGPLLWLAYNAAAYRNPLEFANGPYSARAIAQKDADRGTAPYPGQGSLTTSFSYFLRASELNVADGNWGRLWVALSIAGVMIALKRRALWAVLLLLPAIFYPLSIAYAHVPIYVPGWWPNGTYNLRYGIELLPALSLFSAYSVSEFSTWFHAAWQRRVVLILAIGLFAGSDWMVWRSQPVCLREAISNSRQRMALDSDLAVELKKLDPRAILLMFTAEHGGALLQADFPIARTINENNVRTWIKPTDPESIWERALAHPGTYADYVVAAKGDPVDKNVNRSELRPLLVIHAIDSAPVTLFATVKARAPQTAP